MSAWGARKEKTDSRKIFSRTAEILSLVLSHGFGYLLGSVEKRRARWKALGPKGTTENTKKSRTANRWARVRMLLEDLGPTFIKMGQIFSNRTDILPEELVLELRGLQDKVPTFPFDEAKALIEQELGRPLDQVFANFDPQPIASASIAQVYKATLTTGQRVAVKVQRPGIQQTIQLDLEILTRLGHLFEKLILRSEVIDTAGILQEFSKTIHKELDFKNEGLYLEKFAANFRSDPDIYVPRLYKKVSTKKVLVMEFISGIHPMDFETYAAQGLDRKVIAERGAKAVLKQIFVHGFFHADPHPGNLFILPDGRICFLDFGMMGVIFERYRDKLASMLLSVASGDALALAKALAELSLNPDQDDMTSMEEDVFTLLETFSHLPLKEIDLTDFINKATTLMLTHNLQMPPSLYLLLKALITTEGLGRQLDPDFDFLSLIIPFVQSVFAEKLNPIKAAGRSAESAIDYIGLFHDLPAEMRETLKQVKKGRLSIHMDPDTLEKLLHKADRISNRMAFALVVTGGVMASSLALSSKIPPLWNDIPLIAIIGYIGSGILGLALLISIWRSGRF